MNALSFAKPEKKTQKENDIPVKQVPDFSSKPERRWVICEHCNREVFREANGETFYHNLNCPESNGINYERDR